jgi:outer membrane lipoprotein LolB
VHRTATPALFAVALLVAGCATQPVAVVPPRAAGDAPFAIEGRLSARRGNEALNVNFQWIHTPPSDALVVTTPLGQQLAEIYGDSSVRRVEWRGANGLREEGADWAALTERALGAPLPVDGLAVWMQGQVLPGTPHAQERDAAGRLSLLRQDGWEVAYDYADATTSRPARLQVTRAGIEVRIVVDRWE